MPNLVFLSRIYLPYCCVVRILPLYVSQLVSPWKVSMGNVIASWRCSLLPNPLRVEGTMVLFREVLFLPVSSVCLHACPSPSLRRPCMVLVADFVSLSLENTPLNTTAPPSPILVSHYQDRLGTKTQGGNCGILNRSHISYFMPSPSRENSRVELERIPQEQGTSTVHLFPCIW